MDAINNLIENCENLLTNNAQALFILDEIKKEAKKLKDLALVDELTGLYNRRGLDKAVKNVSAMIKRSEYENTKLPVSVVFFDLDDFKSVNETYDHIAGDKALCHFSEMVKKTLRADDIITRWGGDEFICVLPGATLDVAVTIMNELRENLENNCFDYNGNVININASMGVTQLDENKSFDDAIEHADFASKKAKHTFSHVVTAV